MIWLSFLVQMYKLSNDISGSFFYFFKILVLRVVKEVKGKKIFQNDKNIICPALYLWKIIHHRIVIYGTHL